MLFTFILLYFIEKHLHSLQYITVIKDLEYKLLMTQYFPSHHWSLPFHCFKLLITLIVI